MEEIVFRAKILQNEGRSGGNYIEFPYNTEELFGINGRVPVICYFENVEYRGSLVKMGGDCHIIGILKDIMTRLGKKPGDTMEVKIIRDENERVIIPDPLLKTHLDSDEHLMVKYLKLSYTKKKEINQNLKISKKEETKQKRLEIILKDLGAKKN